MNTNLKDMKNNNLSVLPFYTSLAEQDFRKPYAYGDVYPLFCPINRILPFQIQLPAVADDTAMDVILYSCEGDEVAVLSQAMLNTGLQMVTRSGVAYSTIVYPAYTALTPTGLHGGSYYLYIETGDGYKFYSDIFTWVGDIDRFLAIEWWNKEDLVMDSGRIVYGQPYFRNRLYLNTELGKPEYTFEEEGEQRDGFFFPEKQISEKVYKFAFLANEPLLDVMRFIRMADVARVRDQYGREYLCDEFLITPNWETQGNLASVEAELHTDTVAKKVASLWIDPNLGDFNDDYNDDFDNETE